MRPFNIIILICALLLTVPVQAEQSDAPLIVTGSTGNQLHKLDKDGYIQNSGAKAITPSASWIYKDSAGVSQAGWNYGGVLLANTDNASSSALLNGTGETTVTFATAESDTNYYIIGTLKDSAANTCVVHLKRKNVGTFVLQSNNASATAFYTWFKIRNP